MRIRSAKCCGREMARYIQIENKIRTVIKADSPNRFR